jgi:hypothetical protein
MRPRIATWSLAGLSVLALVGCSSGTSQSAAPASAPLANLASVEPSVAASSAAPSEAAASAEPTLVLPSFVLPSTDKELEALIPNSLCGQAVTKFSFSGSTFETSADPEFRQLLSALGKSPSDVSMAVGITGSSGKCSAGIFRVKGADPNRFKQVFLAAAAKSGDNYSETSIGGKTVLADPNSENIQYGYFKDDALFFASADTSAHAAEVLAALP